MNIDIEHLLSDMVIELGIDNEIHKRLAESFLKSAFIAGAIEASDEMMRRSTKTRAVTEKS